MSIRVYGPDQNPAIDHFLYRCSCSSGANLLTMKAGKPIIDGDGRRAVQLVSQNRPSQADGAESIGRFNLVPFGRVQNPMLAPKKLHYEVPMAGDRTPYLRSFRRKIRISKRSYFQIQLLPIHALSVN